MAGAFYDLVTQADIIVGAIRDAVTKADFLALAIAFAAGVVTWAIAVAIVRAGARWWRARRRPPEQGLEPPPPRGEATAGGPDDAALGEIAQAQWRLARRVRNMRADGFDRATAIGEHVDIIEDYARDIASQLARLDVTVFDPSGMLYDRGMDIKVISREERVGLASETVIETVVPSVSRGDRRVVRPVVVVGVPVRSHRQIA